MVRSLHMTDANPPMSPEMIIFKALAEAAAGKAGEIVDVALDTVSPAFRIIKAFLEIPEHGIGMLTDYVKQMREHNLVALSQRFKTRLEQRSITEPRTVDLGTVVRMLGAASDETDEGLQKRWAELMASAYDPKAMKVSKSHIVALEQMMPHDVRVLDVLLKRRVNVFFPATSEVNDQIQALVSRETGLSEDAVASAITNLTHLGMCTDLSPFTTTGFAWAFWKLCTPPDVIDIEDPELDAAWGQLRKAEAKKLVR